MSVVHLLRKSASFNTPLRHACAECASHDWCLPASLSAQRAQLLDRLIVDNRVIERGGAVYRSGCAFHSLYVIRSGFVKSTITDDDGREQVTGLHMSGELIGMHAINTGRYMGDAVALEDSGVCAIPFGELERLSRDIPALQQHMHRTMSREIAHNYGVMLLLGSMHAEQRIAVFLLNLSQRYAARGYSATRINLRLTREDLGSYLGLKLETVSRVLSRLQEDGLIAVQHKDIEIKDLDRLQRLISNSRDTHRRASRQTLSTIEKAPQQSSQQYA